MKDTKNYEWVELPSKGQCYSINSPLRKGKVKVAYLTAMDENIIVNPKAYAVCNVSDLIIERKIIDKSIDVTTFVKGDRDAILIWLRRTGYGNNFPVIVKNTNINETIFSTSVDLSKIKNREFLLSGDSKGYFTYYMKNGDIVKFKYPTYKEIKDFRKIIIEKEKKKEYKTLINDTLKFLTVSINGNEHIKYVNQYINNMTVEDSFLYRSFIQDNTPSINNIVDVEVKQGKDCETKTIFLQIDDNIFLNVE